MNAWILQAWSVARKDIRSELRTRYALNSLGMFVVITVAVMAFSVGIERLAPAASAALVWIGMFFAAVTGLGRSFVSEEERGTTMLLRLTVPPGPVYAGKLLVNLLLALATDLAMVLLFGAMMQGITIAEPRWLLLVVLLVSLGFAAAMTIIAAIIARAASKGALFPVLSFPVILPLLILGVDLIERSLDGSIIKSGTESIWMLLVYVAALVVVSFSLFDFLWKE